MSNTIEMADAEWEAKWNGPRERLFKKLFNQTPCDIKDVSPMTRVTDVNWYAKKDFMAKPDNRITCPMNSDTVGLDEINRQLTENHGRLVVVERDRKIEVAPAA